MNARRCLKIAERIGALLEREIGIGIEPERMLTDRLYLRDVLLVCEAHRGHELANLALWFRRSAAETTAPRAATPSGFDFDADSVFPTGSGFGSSLFDAQRDSQRDQSGPAPLPSPAEIVRRQLEEQRAAARLGGQKLAARAVIRSA